MPLVCGLQAFSPYGVTRSSTVHRGVVRMAAARKKISTLDLRPGMYVSELDRPWREADVLFQGFYVNTLEQIEELRNKFRYVYVDVWRNGQPGATANNDTEDARDGALRKICGHPKRDNVYRWAARVEGERGMRA